MFAETANLGGVRRIEHQQFGKSVLLPKGVLEHFRAKAGSTHPKQQDFFEPSPFDLFGKGFQFAQMSQLIIRNRQPTQPVPLVLSRPESGVVAPQPPGIASQPPLILGER